jgi:hypothetical protein
MKTREPFFGPNALAFAASLVFSIAVATILILLTQGWLRQAYRDFFHWLIG